MSNHPFIFGDDSPINVIDLPVCDELLSQTTYGGSKQVVFHSLNTPERVSSYKYEMGIFWNLCKNKEVRVNYILISKLLGTCLRSLHHVKTWMSGGYG